LLHTNTVIAAENTHTHTHRERERESGGLTEVRKNAKKLFFCSDKEIWRRKKEFRIIGFD